MQNKIINCHKCDKRDYDNKMFLTTDKKNLCGNCYTKVTNKGQNIFVPLESSPSGRLSLNDVLIAQDEILLHKQQYLHTLKKYAKYYEDSSLLKYCRGMEDELAIVLYKKDFKLLSSSEEYFILSHILNNLTYPVLSKDQLKAIKLTPTETTHPTATEYWGKN